VEQGSQAAAAFAEVQGVQEGRPAYTRYHVPRCRGLLLPRRTELGGNQHRGEGQAGPACRGPGATGGRWVISAEWCRQTVMGKHPMFWKLIEEKFPFGW